MSHNSSSNYRRNKAAIEKFRKELIGMLGDISEIDIAILNKVGNKTVGWLKENTPVVTGFMRKSWRAMPTIKSKTNEIKKIIVNTADYASYVNDGHRVVNHKGETIGFIKGKFMLERALSQADKELVKAFEEEVKKVNQKYDR